MNAVFHSSNMFFFFYIVIITSCFLFRKSLCGVDVITSCIVFSNVLTTIISCLCPFCKVIGMYVTLMRTRRTPLKFHHQSFMVTLIWLQNYFRFVLRIDSFRLYAVEKELLQLTIDLENAKKRRLHDVRIW